MTGRPAGCAHLGAVRDVEARSERCAPCITTGDPWVLCMCPNCDEVACCHSSENRHAHRHGDAVGRPLARSAQPGGDSAWCFVDESLVGVDAR